MPIGDLVSKSASPEHFTRLTSTPSTIAKEPILATAGLTRVNADGDSTRPQRDSHSMSPQDVLCLQRSVGNRAVAQLLQGVPRSQPMHHAASGRLIQRKLAVGPANDPFEREADHAAKQVTRALARPVRSNTVQRDKQDEQQSLSFWPGPAQGNNKTAGKAGDVNWHGQTSLLARAPGALAVPNLTPGRLRPRIQRKVFFELDELQKQDVANLEITKVNIAERPPFLKGRWKTLDKSKGKGKNLDYRHIVSFDLIKKALGRVLKSKTVDQAAAWLGDAKHWIDQGYAAKDMLPPDMLKSVQGTQAAAENWLKNANSYEANLWRGPRQENRQKGVHSALSKGKIRETWANNTPLGEWGKVQDIVATDTTSGSNLPFEDDYGLQFVNLADFVKRIFGFRLQGRLTGSGIVFRAMPGSKLRITMNDKSEITASAVYVVGNAIFRVGRGFEISDSASIPDQSELHKVNRLTKSISGSREQFIDSQVDPSPLGTATTHLAARNSLLMYDATDTQKPVVDIALSGTKYEMQKARLSGDETRASAAGGVLADPQLESDIQRASSGGAPLDDAVRSPMEQAFGADFGQVRVHADTTADHLNRSVNAKAFTTGHSIFFRQGYYKPNSASGRELLAHELAHVVQQKRGAPNGESTLQRKVHFELREKAKINPQPQQLLQDPAFFKWKIKHVEISGRPPILKSRQGDNRTKKGEDYRHIVSFTLIAKALRKVLKGMTIEEAAAWLNDRQNWIDQENVDDDMLDQRFMNSIQGIQAAADNWLKNANSFKANLWPGHAEENRQKGGAAAGAKKKIKKHWVGPKVIDTSEGVLISQSSSGDIVPFEDSEGNRHSDILSLSKISDGVFLKAMMGAKFYAVLQAKGQIPLGSAIYITGGAVHTVGRNFQEPKSLDKVRDTHLGAQLDHPFGSHDVKTVINSLTIRDKNRQRLPVVTVALGQKPGKYIEQSLLSQISQPLLTFEERAIQEAAQLQKDKMLQFVKHRMGNQLFDQRVWQRLSYPPDAIEEFFAKKVIPNCKIASDVSRFLKKTWDALNAASTAAKEMANIVSYVERNSERGQFDISLNKWRDVICEIAKSGALEKIDALWNQVEQTVPRRQQRHFQLRPGDQQTNQSFGQSQTNFPPKQGSFSQPPRDERSRSNNNSKEEEEQQSKKRTNEVIGSHKLTRSDSRLTKEFRTPEMSTTSLDTGQSTSQSTGLLTSQSMGLQQMPLLGNLQQLNNLLQSLSNPSPSTMPTTMPPLNMPPPNTLPPMQWQSFSFAPQQQLNQNQSYGSYAPPMQQGFPFFSPQQPQVQYVGRYVYILNGQSIVGSGKVLADQGQNVLVSIQWNNGQIESRSFAKDSPNLQWR